MVAGNFVFWCASPIVARECTFTSWISPRRRGGRDLLAGAANLHRTDGLTGEGEQVTVPSGSELEDYFCKFQASCLARAKIKVALDRCPCVFERRRQCPQCSGVVNVSMAKRRRDLHDKTPSQIEQRLSPAY